MKILLTTLALIICFCDVNAQEWFPVGANWYYNQVILFVGNRYRYFEVTGDTIIDGRYCRIVHGACECSEYPGVNYLNVDGEQIYTYDMQEGDFRLLYDFSLQPGDTLRHSSIMFGPTQYLLDSISTLQVDSILLRVQHFSYIDGDYEFGDKVYEFIGSRGCMYPVIRFCDPSTGHLRCYMDSTIGLVKFIDPDLECDYTTSSTKEAVDHDVHIYPNPSSGILNITSDELIKQIDYVEIETGRTIYRNPEVDGELIDLQHIPPGTYILRLYFSDRTVVKKLVVY